MRTFTDAAARTWSIQIHVAAIRRVRGLVGVDLLQLIDDGFKPLAELVGDPVRLADVLYCLVKDQADEANVSDEDFGRALAGDVLEMAAAAFLDELTDFFPDARVRAGLKRVMEAGREVRSKLLDHAEVQIGQLDVDSVAKRLIDSFGSSPASSESTPTPSPSESSS